jgi:hypothetical protein
MDRNTGIDLESQSHVPAADPEHSDLEYALEAGGTADHNRFVRFP